MFRRFIIILNQYKFLILKFQSPFTMKKSLIIFLLSLAVLKTNAQTDTPSKGDSIKTVYIGIGSGLNNYTGLAGVSLNIRVIDRLFVQGGAGLGSWGSKLSAGLRYDLGYDKGWSFGAGISSCSGIPNFPANLELQSGVKGDVKVDLLRANTLNLKATHNWLLGGHNIFYVEFGYAVPLQSSPWRVIDNSVISQNSKKVLDLIAPGGLLVGLGFSFGLF